MKVSIIASHPIQYHAPLFRTLAAEVDLHVFFAHRASPADQARAGFGVPFEWDVDLTAGYTHTFLQNAARDPGLHHFFGCDTPEIGARLSEWKPHVVMLTGWNIKSYIQALWAAKRLNIPTIVRGDSQLGTPRMWGKSALKSVTYPYFLSLFNAAAYVGERSREYFEHYGVPGRKLFFSPHSVDSSWFEARATNEARVRVRDKWGVEAEAWIVLFAGKLVPFKRPGDVIAAAKACRDSGKNVQVMIAGAGELAASLAEYSRTAGVPTHFLGFCNQSEMPSAYAASDCLVLPSDGRETWGLVANEAIACRRPIILSDACGCAPDLGSDCQVGRTFAVGDTDKLADCVAAVMKEPAAEYQFRQVSEKYSLRTAARGIVEACKFARAQQQLGAEV